jgi:diguanylate cyclase
LATTTIQNNDEEPSAAILKVILPLMSKHAAGYFPVSYALWYEYARGNRAELNQHVDTELARRTRLSAQLTHALYAKFQIEPTEQALFAARDNLVNLMSEVQRTVGTAGNSASGFDSSLAVLQEKLEAASSLDDLAGPLATMRAQAGRIAGDFQHLSRTLESRQAEIERLSGELNKLRSENQIDTLSGLLNRRGFERELERHFARGKTTAEVSPLTLIILDIDHFKQINDTFGHPLGDRVITAVGRALLECVGEQGSAARHGGEEFAVLLATDDLDAASRVAEAIRTRVSEGRIQRRQGDSTIGSVTISAGIARLQRGEDALSLIERADQMLYQSKRNGRNRITIDPD